MRLDNFGVMRLIVIIRSSIIQADAILTQRVGPRPTGMLSINPTVANSFSSPQVRV